MHIVKFGGVDIDALPHIEAAMDELGTIRRNGRGAFLTAFVEIFAEGGTGLTMRERGTPMELGGTRMTVEAWDMLNAKGRKDPVRAFDDLVTTISLAIYAEGHAAKRRQTVARKSD